jgi:hypothetical protein
LDKEIDHEYTDTVICPYCGHDNGGDNGDGPPDGEQECNNEECEKKFHCEPDYSVSYSTSKVPCLNNEEPHSYYTPYFLDPNRGASKCRNCSERKFFTREETLKLQQEYRARQG